MEDSVALKHILRAQAWARAKGELDAVLQTYYDESDKFNKIYVEIKQFIDSVQNNQLVE